MKNLFLMILLCVIFSNSYAQCTTTFSTDVQVACNSFTWSDGVVYTSSNTTSTDTFTNAAGCDSVVTLDLTINSSNTGTDVITTCNSYTWTNGITYTASNSTATDTFTNVAGCDSVVTLDLTINSNTGTDVVSTCNSYTWTNGITYTASNNTATDTFINAAGCDSVVTLDLTILSNAITDVRIACDTFTWINGVFYTASNSTASVTLTNSHGCDSVITLDLTINNSSNTTIDAITACGSYTWNGITYTNSNFIAQDTLTNATGCDSIVRLNLTILSTSATTDVISACNSYYTWINGVTYTASNTTATVTYTNNVGCDSVVTLNLTITSLPTTDQIVSCNSYYTWTNGITYTSDNNTDTDTFTNAAGCDSVVTLDLTFTSMGSVDTRIACDTFTWTNGVIYSTNNNTATDTFMNTAGCDSVVTLNLTMNYTSFTVDQINACDSYTWVDGTTYTTTNFFAQYTLTSQTGCDSIVRLNLTVNYSSSSTDEVVACGSYYTWIDGNTYTSDNNTATFVYTNAAGCDSTVSLDLIISSPATTDVITACDSYVWTNGVTYTANNNTAIDTFQNSANCDSLVYLDLTINNSSSSTDSYAVCGGLTWIDGNTYTTDNTTATFTYTNAVGCDSTVTLDLDILSDSTTYAASSCDSFQWIDGKTYYASNNSASFTYTNVAGCDSVIILNLTINNSASSTDVINTCDSYRWTDGLTYTSSNNTALDTFTTSAGCDSIVTLDLTIKYSNSGTDIQSSCDSYTWIDGVTYTSSNNSATYTLTNVDGCDSIVTLDLSIQKSTSSTQVIDVCNSYKWIDGVTYTSSNNSATYTLANAAGCDSTINLDLTIRKSTSGTDVITACDSYKWIDGVTYLSSNNSATYTITNGAGCDSVVSLDLTINNSSSATDIITACDNYTWIDGITYTVSNSSATHTLMNIAGCDSLVSLDLTINYSKTSTDIISACNNYTWVNGKIYTSNNNSDTYTYTTVDGCDSVVTLNLTINYRTLGKDVVASCSPYVWIDGSSYTENNNSATFTLTNASGCDSIVTLNLTILESSSGKDVRTECISYTWIDGIIYTESTNTPTFTLANAAGCDSVVSLDLTILTIDKSITIGDPLMESVLEVGASYQWLDCDNGYAIVTGKTSNVFRATDNGSYAVEIKKGGCSDTSDCVTIQKASIQDNAFFKDVVIYPNPTSGLVNVDLESLSNATIKVYDMNGRAVYSNDNIVGNAFQFNLDAAPGMYIIEIQSNEQFLRTRLIKK
ncbi:MAG: hypothetical protein COA58_10365 [Bacteroidetes bacterium]|nr:MAG: hypothetical protein COA58_10365 [Bacteroidota bacterium]